MKVYFYRPIQVVIISLVLALVGCLGGQSPPTNFYMLSPLSSSPAVTAPATGKARIYIGLEPVVVAEYLDRNEIVTNLNNTIYQLAEFNQWAEPLSENLTRVLEENMTKLLQNDSIEVSLASESSIPFDYRLEVDVLRLDGNLGGRVTLVAQWALLKADEDDLIGMRRSEYQEQAADNTYKELVLAESRTIKEFCRDMAVGIRKALQIRTG